jgi:pyridinium-3,5-bisthiocarboxylic acid mononucleotide nickel chelatase
VPNVLRVMLGELADSMSPLPPESHGHYEITANIDDMTPESFEPLLERLLEAGASDAFLTPIVMKKSRLAHMMTVLCSEQKLDPLVQVVFEHSTTIGVRLTPVGKRMLPRTLETVVTSHGEVRVKIVSLPNGVRRWKVEHDDVKRLAAEHGISYLALGKDIESEVREKLNRVGAPA